MTLETITQPSVSDPVRAADPAPVFIAGPDRSGTTLIFALLASHPDLSMARRTNMWRYFHGRYGDLRSTENLDRCLADMVGYRRMRHLSPDAERIRREFLDGPRTYGRLFALFHEHHAERAGKARWGDKSLHTERYAARVLDEFPNARIIHMIRDPRDRYASVRKRYGRDRNRVGAATARWVASTRAGIRNARQFPGSYMHLRYEDLAQDPEATMRRVCDFIGIDCSPAMFTMGGAPEHRDSGGNSSFGDLEPGAISTRAIGRFREVLSSSEIAFIQVAAGRELRAAGYEMEDLHFSAGERAKFLLAELPLHGARMLGSAVFDAVGRWRGERVPSRHQPQSSAT